ncbi:M23 family metallopeptidase [Shewanella avicenniae]|uniref:M23 family metallopeptidase n=1 Tax=Shewanella avicenniae TaxID=2814294 RepID=A0ABX7QW21_9GAMM|nr:M23 family metallopeptidase [Shewanella avicenniae]QSX35464.1 M23 family metallopeptidase [Shewanella avicenniae]
MINLLLCSICLNQSYAVERTTLSGVIEQGALIRGKTLAGSRVSLDGEALKITADGNFVFGFDRDSAESHQLSISYPDGSQEQRALTVAKQDYRISRIEGISKEIMQPDPADVARAKLDSQMVREARDTSSDLKAFMSQFIWPVTGRISGVYGSQRIYNGVAGNPHFGVDIARPTGTVVVAPADGVVTLAVPDMFYSGGTMVIDHGFGVSSSFLHLSKLYVKPGRQVKQGQKVAEVGATGRATGPHLDWRLNWYQMRLNPQSIVPSMESVLAVQKSNANAQSNGK